MKRLEHQPAYVLHSRPYRDTSALIDFFTVEWGRVTAVARGVHQKKNRNRALLNPFSRLLVSLHGKQDLKLLTSVESDHGFYPLQGERLYSGFYINELLLRLLPDMDAHTSLFDDYEQALEALRGNDLLEPILRRFELAVLADLGYGLDCEFAQDSGEPINESRFYLFNQQGFIDVASVPSLVDQPSISGRTIAAMANNDFTDAETRVVAKMICRRLLRPLLGSRPLNSRALFATPKS